MSRWGFWWGACLLVLGGCSVPSLGELMGERTLPLSVSYPKSFTKGCLHVVARGVGSTGAQTEITLEDLARQSPPWRPTLLRRAEWTGDVEIFLRAREQDCRGKVVEEHRVTFPVGKSQELMISLSMVDVDGDGFIASSSGGSDCDDLDRERSPAHLEVCDNKDNNCDSVVDEGLDKSWYLDGDGDGVPRGSDFVVSCSPPGSKYMQYSTVGPFDCVDSGLDAAKMFPGNSEACDGIDNNCSGDIDEGFSPRGVSCNSECGGVTVCAADGHSVVCSQSPGRYYYPDRDGDGQGAAGSSPTLKCETEPGDPGAVTNDDDCDDVDPASRLGLMEVCDAIDNDCDGVVDNTAQACGGTLKDVADYHTGGSAHDWRTVSTGPGGYPVWIAGRGGKLAVRKTATSKFESFSHGDATGTTPDGSPPAKPSDGCGDHNWTTSWVASYGHVFLAGEGGYLAIHDGTTCAGTPGSIGTATLTGIVGFETPPATTTLYLTDTEGRLIKWVVGGTPAFTTVFDTSANYYGIHGLGMAAILVVGGVTGADPGQEFVSHSDAVVFSMHTALPDNATGTANAVWMGRAGKACAVGDGGVAWRWDGSKAWSRAEASGTVGNFSSVVMRYDPSNPAHPLNEHCYVVDKGTAGRLRRLTPYGWARQFDLPATKANIPLHDIAITSTGNIWVVGDDGRVFHYPEP